MSGVLHIFPRGSEEFQVSLTLGSRSYATVYGPEQLKEFLARLADLDNSRIQDVLNKLSSEGRATLQDVSVPETEAPMLGMQEMPSDA